MNYLKSREIYLQRYAASERVIQGIINRKIDHFIIIPAFEEESLLQVLESLWSCTAPRIPTLVLVVINYPLSATVDSVKFHKKCQMNVMEWGREHLSETLRVEAIDAFDLPEKTFGVGLARKIGMDHAIRMTEHNTILSSLDADCTVDNNYFHAIEDYFSERPNSPGASIYFEHSLDEIIDDGQKEGIIRYELFLRYFNQAQRFAGFPWAFHTVGSSMSVRSDAYIMQGGMNTKKAGEDFYFLHRMIPLGGFGEINATRVVPSSRISTRVPFGTGRAMLEWSENRGINAYPLELFIQLREFNERISDVFYSKKLPECSGSWGIYMNDLGADDRLKEILVRSTTKELFIKNFYSWLNAFRIMKYVNQFPRVKIEDEAHDLLTEMGIKSEKKDVLSLLLEYRKLERTTEGL